MKATEVAGLPALTCKSSVAETNQVGSSIKVHTKLAFQQLLAASWRSDCLFCSPTAELCTESCQ